MPRLKLNLFGGFEASLGDRPVDLPRKKSRALLSYLALNSGQPHSREKIAGLLWGNSGEEQARASLRQTLTDLRRALPPEEIEGLVIDGDAFSIDSSATDVDVISFHDALEEEGPSSLKRAVAMYRGELLEGFSLREPEFQEWLETERAHLRRLVMDAFGKLINYYESTRELDDAIFTANRLLEFDSLQEEVHLTLMRLYVGQGRRSQALQQYEICRDVLREELEVDPADETESFYRDIRDQRELVTPDALETSPKIERKLAAILAADVVGYSRLMGGDEETTLSRLRDHREVIDGLIAAHSGRVFGSAGDSVIAEFVSPVSAVRCAIEIQTKLEERESDVPEEQRMRFRIGINLGDVLIENQNLMGDGVNVAARLEALAPPGGICVSDSVAVQVRDRLEHECVDQGEYRVKNIQRPVRVYRIPLASEAPLTSPFRGLSMFEIEHAKLFFGRSRAISATKDRIEHQAAAGTAFLLIFGMSGAGKSSLLRAGLLPAILEPRAVTGISEWRWSVFRPSEAGEPIVSLVNGLFDASALPELAAETSPQDLASLFLEAPERAINPIRRALTRAADTAEGIDRQLSPSQPRLIVAVDQLEEIFTGDSDDDHQNTAFVRALATLARSGLVWVIGTLRADFFYRCAEIPELSALRDGFGSYELLPPDGPGIAQIIREPAAAAGIRFEETSENGRLEDVLQETAMRDPASLPLLEFLLARLFEAGRERRLMTFADYRALGGLEGAIAQRADEVTGALSSGVQDALPAVLWAITTVHLRDQTVGGRTAPYAEVASTRAQIELVDALVDARLLVSDEDTAGNKVVRLAHDSLLSYWPRARAIVAENRAFLETRSRLQTDVHLWLSDNKNPDLLLPHGKRLAEAQELLEFRQEEFDPDLIEYVEVSDLAEQQRRREEEEAERRHLAAEAEKQRLAAERERLAAATARDRESAAHKLARRTRIAAVATSILAVVAGIGAIVGFYGQQEATKQAEIAEQREGQARSAESIAIEARNETLRNQSLYLADLSRQQTARGDGTTGLLLALEALPRTTPPERPYVVQAEAALYEALTGFHELGTFVGHRAGLTDLQFGPTGDLVTASRDGTARIWRLTSGGDGLELAGHRGTVQAVAISPDGTRVAATSRDDTATLWDTMTGQKIATMANHRGDVLNTEFSPDGERLLTVSRDRTARLWATKNGAEIAVLRGHKGPLSAGGFSPNGETAATGSWDRTARLWNAQTGKLLNTLEGHTDRVNYVGFDPASKRLVTASRDQTARIWDVASGTELAVLRGHTADVLHAAFGPNGRYIATSSADGTTRLWDAQEGTVVHVLLGHGDSVARSAFNAAGDKIVTASTDGTARLWVVETGSLDAILGGHEGPVVAAAFSSDGSQIATASQDGTAKLWTTTVESSVVTLSGHLGAVLHAEFDKSSRRVVTASADGTARIWNAATGSILAELRGHDAQVRWATFSANGEFVITASEDATARIWDAASGREMTSLVGHSDLLTQAAFNKDGTKALTSSRDGTARYWDVETGREISTLQGHDSGIVSFSLGAEDSLVVTASTDFTARLWNTSDGQIVSLFEASKSAPVGLAILNSDGSHVFTCSGDGRAVLWNALYGTEIASHAFVGPCPDAAFSASEAFIIAASGSVEGNATVLDGETGTLVAELVGHTAIIRQVDFSPSLGRALTASRDRTIRVWDIASGQAIAVLQGHKDEILSASFSPDGQKIISASADGTAKIFTVFSSTEDLVNYAKNIPARELTPCQRARFFLESTNDGSCRR